MQPRLLGPSEGKQHLEQAVLGYGDLEIENAKSVR